MLDQIRRDIKTRLDELLGEADKLRQALAALGSHQNVAPTSSAKLTSTSSPKPSRSVPTKPAGRPSPTVARSAPGATRTAILAALAGGLAMTAGEIATATGLGRATVSTTLSRLAKTGEVTKAARGYQANPQTVG
jgi:DNA-binding transcriptional ArsR family regulator